MVGSGPWHRDHTPPTRTHACSTHAQQARPRGRGKRLKWHRFTIFRALRAPSTATAPKSACRSPFSVDGPEKISSPALARGRSVGPLCATVFLPCTPLAFASPFFGSRTNRHVQNGGTHNSSEPHSPRRESEPSIHSVQARARRAAGPSSVAGRVPEAVRAGRAPIDSGTCRPQASRRCHKKVHVGGSGRSGCRYAD